MQWLPIALPLLLPAIAWAADEPRWRIYGGEAAQAGAWPDAGALLRADRFQCSAVLIHPKVALTAGHCSLNADTLVLDSLEWRQGGERLPIQEIVRHPEHLTTYDLALVILDQPAQTPPARLALDCEADALYDGVEAWIVGFGATDSRGSRPSETLQVGQTQVEDADCDDVDRGCNAEVLPGAELRAAAGVDTCNGDSGGPLYVPGLWGPALVGVTSRGSAPATSACGDGGIYVRVDAAVPWIEATAGITLPRPSCGGALNQRPIPEAPRPLRLRAGTSRSWSLTVTDPDPEDHHRWSLLNPPRFGLAEMDEQGRFTYSAPPNSGGLVRARVAVTDDGDPALSAVLELPILVVPWPEDPPEPAPEGGCRHAPAPAGGSLLLTLLLRRRTSRPRPGRRPGAH